MGRPTKEPSERAVKYTVTFNPDLLRRVREHCSAENVTIASFLARAVETALNEKKPDVRKEIVAIQSALNNLAIKLK